MGILGLSLEDFEALTPDEFSAVAAAGKRKGEEEWERTRALACWMLQPYAGKGKSIRPEDLVRFPWEEREGGERRQEESVEELRARFEQVKRERGLQ